MPRPNKGNNHDDELHKDILASEIDADDPDLDEDEENSVELTGSDFLMQEPLNTQTASSLLFNLERTKRLEAKDPANHELSHIPSHVMGLARAELLCDRLAPVIREYLPEIIDSPSETFRDRIMPMAGIVIGNYFECLLPLLNECDVNIVLERLLCPGLPDDVNVSLVIPTFTILEAGEEPSALTNLYREQGEEVLFERFTITPH